MALTKIHGSMIDSESGSASAGRTALGLGTVLADVAANLAAVAAKAATADLASTVNAEGASLIGVEDSGAKYTATTVEGALAEIATANNTPIKTAMNASGSAPIYACRAWVNFNGTGTVAIRASGNVSSITDNGTGSYEVNFTTALPNMTGAYFAEASQGTVSSGYDVGGYFTSTSTATVVTAHPTTGVATDCSHINVAIFC